MRSTSSIAGVECVGQATLPLVGASFDDVHRAVLAIASERSAEAVLQRVADAARELTAADYAALGVPDGHGGFSRFVTSGIDDDTTRAIGPLPRTHGLLGAQLGHAEPYRVDDVRRDPRFGGWPSPHPEMAPFLGVPVVGGAQDEAGGVDVTGALYVTRDAGGDAFDSADLERLGLLADHAAVAIENATLWERTRELVMASERAHLARELHDAMTQRLFSLRLTAEAAASTVRGDPDAAAEHLETVAELARQTLAELRTVILDLRPADLETDGLGPALSTHVDLLRRAHGLDLALVVDLDEQLPSRTQREVFRVAQEALHNVVRHAGASHVDVGLRAGGGRVELEVRDDGRGFDPRDRGLRSTRLGLASMRHRARALGGTLVVESQPEAGTSVRLEAPVGR
jgi:signal transduction histidine kinase